jgi:hypothetical protein
MGGLSLATCSYEQLKARQSKGAKVPIES